MKEIPIELQVWFPAALKAIKNDDFQAALDLLDRIYLRVFKWMLAEMRQTKH
jgi:hypothetical protein